MPETFSQTLQNWQTFYFLVGGAAAGLVGLTFVAITVGSGALNVQNVAALRTFVNPSLIHFIYVLITAAVVVMPAITGMQLGILLVLAGLVSAGRALTSVPFIWQRYKDHVVDMHDWAWYFAVPFVSYLIYILNPARNAEIRHRLLGCRACQSRAASTGDHETALPG